MDQPVPNLRFTKAERLLSPTDFARVREHGVSKGGFGLVMGIAANGLDFARLGVVVSKRVGGAVQRNRIKRRFREIFRLNKTEVVGFDVVLIGRANKEEPSFEKLVSTFHRLAAELKQELALKQAAQAEEGEA